MPKVVTLRSPWGTLWKTPCPKTPFGTLRLMPGAAADAGSPAGGAVCRRHQGGRRPLRSGRRKNLAAAGGLWDVLGLRGLLARPRGRQRTAPDEEPVLGKGSRHPGADVAKKWQRRG